MIAKEKMTLSSDIAAAEQYGSLAITYGPRLWAALAPILSASSAKGTLEADVPAIVEAVEKLAPILAPMVTGSITAGTLPADLANLIPAIAQLVPALGPMVGVADLAIQLLSLASQISPDTTPVPEDHAVPVGMDNGPVQAHAKDGG